MTSPATPSLSSAPHGSIYPVLALALGLFPLAALRLQAQDPAPPPLEPAAEAKPPAVEEQAKEGFAPTEYPKDRYDKMLIRSPFDFELAKVAETAPVNPFTDLVLAGFAGGASRPTVYLMNSKTQERITILSEGAGRKNDNGFKIITVDRGRTLSSTTATIEKDGVQEVLKFDSKVLYSMTGGAGGGGAAAGGRQSPLPGQPGVPGQVPRPVVPGQQPRPVQAYVAPQAFIPGNQSGSGGGGRPMQQGGAQPALAVPPNTGPGANAAQQQLNALLANSTGQGAIQPTVIPANANAAPNAPAAPVPNQAQPNRRRVVLPSQ